MLLAIDVGNSQTSFGVFKNSQLIHHWRIETRPNRTADEYAGILLPILNQAGLQPNWDGVAICSVVPASEAAIEKFCADYFNLIPLRIHSELDLGFTIGVDFPQEVGADRLANAAYAVKNLPLPAIVVDFGTATTFDLISQSKAYEGGVILPGVLLGAKALSGGTSKLPAIPMAFPKSVVGKNTVACIQSGLLYGYCDTLDGLIRRFEEELGTECHVVLTGGTSDLFHSRLKKKTKLLPNLTLEGIELVYRANDVSP